MAEVKARAGVEDLLELCVSEDAQDLVVGVLQLESQLVREGGREGGEPIKSMILYVHILVLYRSDNVTILM